MCAPLTPSYAGPPAGLADAARCPPGAEQSATRRFLTGAARLAPGGGEPRPGTGLLQVCGARLHNLQALDASFRLGALNVVTAVSGAGKSTLVMLVLGGALRRHLEGQAPDRTQCQALEGAEQLDKLVEIDQAPLGRTPRSNAATYTKLFDRVRGLFAATDQARALGFGKGRFSFNNKGGRCEDCEGAGVQTCRGARPNG